MGELQETPAKEGVMGILALIPIPNENRCNHQGAALRLWMLPHQSAAGILPADLTFGISPCVPHPVCGALRQTRRGRCEVITTLETFVHSRVWPRRLAGDSEPHLKPAPARPHPYL